MIRTTLAATVLLLVVSSLGLAQNTGEAAGGSTIGIVSVQRAVEESPDYRTAGEAWTAEMSRRSSAVRAKQDELIATQDRVAAAQAGASDEERAAMTAEVERIQNDLARMRVEIQRDLNALRDEMLRPVVEKVGAAIRAYATDQGLTLVLDISHPEVKVLFLDESVDITDAILERLGAENAEPAAPQP